jgi:hypothetical protein
MDIKVEKAYSASPLLNGVNSNTPPCKAYVIGNVGDPGLTSDYYVDILSRFVLAIKEPRKRPMVTAGSDGAGIFLQDNLILVARPQQLWISCPSGMNVGVTQPSQLTRVDAQGNVNVGSYVAFSTNEITPINAPYKVGEVITVQKMRDYLTADTQFFQSWFSTNGINTPYLGSNAAMLGQTLPASLDDSGKIVGGGKANGTVGQFDPAKNYFYINLPKADYENFINSYFLGRGYQPGANIPPNTEYVFGSRDSITFKCSSYVDLNVGGKERVAGGSCLPTIVATPDSFLTPMERQTTYFYYTQI